MSKPNFTREEFDSIMEDTARLETTIDAERDHLWEKLGGGRVSTLTKTQKLLYSFVRYVVSGFFGVDKRIKSFMQAVQANSAATNRTWNTNQVILAYLIEQQLHAFKEIEAYNANSGPNVPDLDPKAFGGQSEEAIQDRMNALGAKMFEEGQSHQHATKSVEDHLNTIIKKHKNTIQDNLSDVLVDVKNN